MYIWFTCFRSSQRKVFCEVDVPQFFSKKNDILSTKALPKVSIFKNFAKTLSNVLWFIENWKKTFFWKSYSSWPLLVLPSTLLWHWELVRQIDKPRRNHVFLVTSDKWHSIYRQCLGGIPSERCSQKLQESLRKTHVPEFLFNKVAGLRLATLSKRRLRYIFFAVSTAKYLRAPFLQRVAGQLLLWTCGLTELRIE